MTKKENIQIIVKKYLEGKSNSNELEEAFDIFSNPYKNLWIRPVLLSYWEKDEATVQKNIPDLKNADHLLDKIHHRINIEADKKQKTKKIFYSLFKIAAVLFFGIFMGLLAQNLKQAAPVFYEAISPKGSVSQLVLPDKSTVFLNAGTELKYTEETKSNLLFKKQTIRKVSLNGEAWFDISKNEKKPFVVHTPFYDVEVLGTQFNIKAYPEDNEVTTTLEKGSIKISSVKNIPDNYEIIIKPNNQFVFNKEKGIHVNNVNTRMFTAWKENKLIFINMNLKELFILLERKYGVDIEVTDNIILNYHYDSTIKSETIIEVLDLIAETLPIKYRIEGQKIIIYNKK